VVGCQHLGLRQTQLLHLRAAARSAAIRACAVRSAVKNWLICCALKRTAGLQFARALGVGHGIGEGRFGFGDGGAGLRHVGPWHARRRSSPAPGHACTTSPTFTRTSARRRPLALGADDRFLPCSEAAIGLHGTGQVTALGLHGGHGECGLAGGSGSSRFASGLHAERGGTCRQQHGDSGRWPGHRGFVQKELVHGAGRRGSDPA
jgi:hypothetical protein